MATSATEDIYTPDLGDQYAVVQDLLTMADSIDDAFVRHYAALDASKTSFIGTDAERQDLDPPLKREGIRWYCTDTNLNWFFDGGNWVVQSNLEHRAYQIVRSAVPAGSTAYYLTQADEITGERTASYPTVNYNSTGGIWTLEAGLYLINVNAYIDWANGGTGAMVRMRDVGSSEPARAQGNFGGSQATSFTTIFLSTGSNQFYLEGLHNSGGSFHIRGMMRLLRLRRSLVA